MRASVTPVRRVGGLALVAAVLRAGCKVDARVDVTLRADGSGMVTARVALDADGEEIVFRAIEGVEPPPVELAGSGSEG